MEVVVVLAQQERVEWHSLGGGAAQARYAPAEQKEARQEQAERGPTNLESE